MPDITKCTNDKCSLADKCYRFTCEPSEYWQSYDYFEPNGNECEKFIEVKTEIEKL
nr:MAG TPA: hypothetical protein [Caudoviricetes sp.]